MSDERGYFRPGAPAEPLRVEGGRVIIDANDVMWVRGNYMRDDYTPAQGVLKGGIGAANCDNFVRELTARFNQHTALVDLVRTVLRELSPRSATAFHPRVDVPRIYQHLRERLLALGIDPNIVGGPAVLEVPPMPEDFAEHPDEVEDHWQTAWLAGYRAAWAGPAATTTEEKDT